jgi:hypothetical protein
MGDKLMNGLPLLVPQEFVQINRNGPREVACKLCSAQTRTFHLLLSIVDASTGILRQSHIRQGLEFIIKAWYLSNVGTVPNEM